MIGGIGLPELIVIFLVILLLFGAKALPEMARGLGQALKIFKKEIKDVKESIDQDENSPEKTEKVSGPKKDTSQDYDPNAEKRDWRAEVKKDPGPGEEKDGA